MFTSFISCATIAYDTPDRKELNTVMRGWIQGSIVLLAVCLAAPAGRGAPGETRSGGGTVVSACSIATAVGRDVLERGGNAMAASVATGFALAVTWPTAGNVGGGGFLLFRGAGGDSLFVDFRETAPSTGMETGSPSDSLHKAANHDAPLRNNSACAVPSVGRAPT